MSLREYWCSECGQDCHWSNGNETALPPRCSLHPKAAVYRRSPEGVRVRSGWGHQHDPLAVGGES